MDDIEVKIDDGDDCRVAFDDGVTINDDLEIEMGDGDGNDLTIETGVTIEDDLEIEMGDGNNTITIGSVVGERVVTVGDDLEIETGDGADNVRISNTTVEDGKIDVDLGGDDDTLTIEGITARKARFNGGRGDRDTLLDDGNDIDKSKNKNFVIFLP